MGNGQWTMGNGQWAMGNGQWAMGKGQWAMDNGQWTMAKKHSADRCTVLKDTIANLFDMSNKYCVDQMSLSQMVLDQMTRSLYFIKLYLYS